MANRVAPPHPGQILLKRAMEPLGISRNQLARDLDVPVGRISDITNGKRGITADTALRFGRFFGTGPELWLRLQAEYDIGVARAANWKEIEARVRVLDMSDTFEDEDEAFTGDEDGEQTESPANNSSMAVEAAGKELPTPAASDGAAAKGPEPHAPSDESSAQDEDEDIGIPPAPSSQNTPGSA